jgi:hypothetical protein
VVYGGGDVEYHVAGIAFLFGDAVDAAGDV